MRLNLGCGRDIREGWVNVDSIDGPGVDLVLDLELGTLPFAPDTVTEVYGAHVIEHLREPLPLMGELWRVARNGCVATFRTPYGSSDDADEDPTHVRRVFPNSWLYFAQPTYWRAHYGYVGDWQPKHIDLLMNRWAAQLPDEEVPIATQFQRNVIREMVATLHAVKPAREARRELIEYPSIKYVRPK